MLILEFMCTSSVVMKLPPGIQNSGNICFASSILHCLFNQSFFRDLLYDVKQSHSPECENCKCGK